MGNTICDMSTAISAGTSAEKSTRKSTGLVGGKGGGQEGGVGDAIDDLLAKYSKELNIDGDSSEESDYEYTDQYIEGFSMCGYHGR